MHVIDVNWIGLKLRKLPGWQHVYRVADALGAAGPKRPVIFECVGLPGMIDGIIAAAPLTIEVRRTNSRRVILFITNHCVVVSHSDEIQPVSVQPGSSPCAGDFHPLTG